MSFLLQILNLIREYLFPANCPLCGKMLLEAEEARYGLCNQCRSRFVPDDAPRCSSCGRPLVSERDRCLPCREGEGYHFDGAFTLYPYTGKYRELLRAYKFGKYPVLGNFFTEKMFEVLPRFPGLTNPVWVPVPPRPGKLKHTGWDQVEYLAGRLEGLERKGRWGASKIANGNNLLPVCRCLKRLPSKSQKKLNRENRRTNLRGKIILSKKPPSQVILFDDVITTGSTLDACAAALKAGGAEKVYALCLFYD